MGFLSKLFGKPNVAEVQQKRDDDEKAARRLDLTSRTEAASGDTDILGNWRMLSGADAVREAIAQRVMDSSDNFAAVLITPVKLPSSSWVTLTGSITCHGCQGICPLEKRLLLGGGLESSSITCRCGSQMTLLLAEASQQGAAFVVVHPFTSIRGQAVSQIGLHIDKITAEGEGQEVGTGKVRRFEGHGYLVMSVVFTPDGRRALVGDGKGQLWLWDLESGQEIHHWQGHTEWVSSVAISRDGEYAVSGSKDETIRLWDLGTYRELRKFQVGEVSRVALAPDGRHAALVSRPSGSDYADDCKLAMLALDTGQEVHRYPDHGLSYKDVVFTPDGSLLFSGSRDKTVRVWEVASGKEVFCHPAGAEVTSVSCSPDGRQLLYGTYGTNLICLLDVESRREIQHCKGHTGSVSAVVFSPDGRYALSGSWDHTARLWDLNSGREIQRFVGQPEQVRCVAFSPDGRFVLIGGLDEVLRLYTVSQG